MPKIPSRDEIAALRALRSAATTTKVSVVALPDNGYCEISAWDEEAEAFFELARLRGLKCSCCPPDKARGERENTRDDAEHMAALLNAAPSLLDAAALAHDLAEALKTTTEALNALHSFYGQGLEVANYHQNGDLEALDNFFDENGTPDAEAVGNATLARYHAACGLVPCSGDNCDTLIPAGSGPTYTGFCPACDERRVDAVAASLPGQEIENEGWEAANG